MCHLHLEFPVEWVTAVTQQVHLVNEVSVAAQQESNHSADQVSRGAVWGEKGGRCCEGIRLVERTGCDEHIG
ncbi:unannotated protein [freshwater metagenome]|uniref:Unannotated protein n=1 Tax=freshwater metagenome TaxID=449393 RepID=A0A6J7SJD8_9ZZZZ